MATVSVNDILTYARVLAKTNIDELSDSSGTAFVNDALFDMRRKLIALRQDLYVQESQRSIQSNQIVGGSQPGKFLFPDDMWLLKNIQVNLTDPSNQGLYVESAQVDSSNLANGTSWEYVKQNQPTNQPVFDYRGDWFEIAPTPTTAQSGNAIKIFYFLAPTPISATSNTLSFPETMDFRSISKKVASLHLKSLGVATWTELDKEYNEDILNTKRMIGSGEQSPVKTQVIQDTGWQY